MKPITHLNRCRLTAEQKAEIVRDGEHMIWGSAEGYMYKNTFYVTKGKVLPDTFAGGRQKSKRAGYTFSLNI